MASFFILIGFLSYRHFAKQKNYELIEIYPDHNITKIKPHETSNNSLASDNTIYDNFKAKKSSTRKVNLVPEPEQPINIVVNNINVLKNNLKSSNIDPIDLILAEIAGSEQQSSNLSAIDTAMPNLSNLASVTSENKKLENFTYFDQNILPAKNSSKIQEIEVVPTANNENYKNIKITKVTENNKLIDNLTSKRDSSFKIQLASVKSETLGKLEGERIQKKFPKILGELNISVQKIEPKKNKVFYLVLAGSFANISKAKAACRKLSAKDQICIVTR